MSKNTPETSVIPINQAAVWSPDPLTEVLRTGAQRLLAQAVEAEIEAHLADHKELLDDRGRRRVVRHGHLPERQGSHPRGLRRADPVPLHAVATVSAADPLAGTAAALAVPEGRFHGGLRGSLAGLCTASIRNAG